MPIDPDELTERLQQVEKELGVLVQSADDAASFQAVRPRLTQAYRLVTGVLSVVASELSDLPDVSDVEVSASSNCPKTEKGLKSRDAAVQFILKRVHERGAAIPVSIREIMEHTHLTSRANVSLVLKGLIQEGKIISVRGYGFGGYLPSKSLYEEHYSEKRGAELSPQ